MPLGFLYLALKVLWRVATWAADKFCILLGHACYWFCRGLGWLLCEALPWIFSKCAAGFQLLAEGVHWIWAHIAVPIGQSLAQCFEWIWMHLVVGPCRLLDRGLAWVWAKFLAPVANSVLQCFEWVWT